MTLSQVTSPVRSVRPGVFALPTTEAEEELGPFATAFGSIYLVLAFVLAAPAYPLEPWAWTLALGLPIGAFLLAPKVHLKRIIFDGPVIVLGAWIILSLLWTRDPEFGTFNVRRDMPLLLTVSMTASLLPKKAVIRAVRIGLAVGIGLTVIGLLVDPATRSHASDGIYIEDYPGWHGYFIHKNVLAPYLIFAMITTLMFEKNAIRRGLLLAIIAVLMVGSDSATGMSAAIFVIAGWVWFRLYHRSDGRWSSAYVLASISAGLCALMGAIASLSQLTSAYGKDLTFSGRTYIWSAVLNAISDEPWVGYGVGGVFWDARSTITRSIWRDIGFSVPHSHNGALDVWLNFGLIGLMLFALVFITTTSMGIRLVRRSPAIGEWVLLLVAAQFLMGLSENVFLGGWLTYMAIVRGVAQRELNTFARDDARKLTAHRSDTEASFLTSPHRV